MRPGDRIHHKIWGYGTVLKATDHTPPTCVRVEWDADKVKGKVRKETLVRVNPEEGQMREGL